MRRPRKLEWLLFCPRGVTQEGRSGWFGSSLFGCTGRGWRDVPGLRTVLVPREGQPWPCQFRDLCASQSPGLGKANQLAFEGHPKLLLFYFLLLFHPYPPHFSLLSAVTSSSITQTPNTSEGSHSIKSLLTPAGSWVKGQQCLGGRGVCKEEPVLLLQPPSLPSPPFSNDTQWSITPQQSERCPEASLWSGAIDQGFFFFLKKDDNDNPWT